MRVIGINTCSTCRQAMKDLAADGKDPAFIDLRKDGFPDALLADVLAAFGNRAVNRASATWRGLDEAERSRPRKTCWPITPRCSSGPRFWPRRAIRWAGRKTRRPHTLANSAPVPT